MLLLVDNPTSVGYTHVSTGLGVDSGVNTAYFIVSSDLLESPLVLEVYVTALVVPHGMPVSVPGCMWCMFNVSWPVVTRIVQLGQVQFHRSEGHMQSVGRERVLSEDARKRSLTGDRVTGDI